VVSLVEHGRIKTTLAKAKELRRHVERAVTLGKRALDGGNALHVQRLLMSRYPNEATVTSLMKDVAPRFKAREGGYTRILKLGMRPGDRAEMAYIEFVDFKPKAVEVKKTKGKADGEGAEKAAKPSQEEMKLKRVSSKQLALRKKHLRKRQTEARKVARA